MPSTISFFTLRYTVISIQQPFYKLQKKYLFKMGNTNDQQLLNDIKREESLISNKNIETNYIISPDEHYAVPLGSLPLSKMKSIDKALTTVFDRERTLPNTMKIVKSCPTYRIKTHNAIYKGQWSDCKPHGTGVVIYPDGSYYEGQFVAGELQGMGLFIFSQSQSGPGKDRTYYRGEWKRSMFEGNGKMVQWNLSYEGGWTQGKRNGKDCKELQEDMGYSFLGDYVDGYKEGKGRYQIITESTALTYDGNFHRGKFDGQGNIFLNGVIIFEGKFKEGKKHGEGKLIGVHGILDANWVNGKVSGKGTYLKTQGKKTFTGQVQILHEENLKKILIDGDLVGEQEWSDMDQFTQEDFQKNAKRIQHKNSSVTITSGIMSTINP